MDTREYKEGVKRRLERLEAEKGVKILYAAVVGSRAYGLDSESSDCDCKFIYVHPLERYLAIDCPKEYIDAGEDVTGYELRKFMQMARKSGFNTFEMLNSPEAVVVADDEFLRALREACEMFIDPRKMCISYLACMQRSKACFEKAADEAVMVKHAVSAARLYLSAYACHFTQAAPPVVFDELVEKVCCGSRESLEFAAEMRRFADAKRNGIGAVCAREFMDTVMACGDKLAKVVLEKEEETDRDKAKGDKYLNKLFREVIFTQDIVGCE